MVKTDIASWIGTPQYWHKLALIYSGKIKADPKAHLYTSLAQAEYKLGRIDNAIATLGVGIDMFPSGMAARVMMAKLYYAKGDTSYAKIILEETVGRWPSATGAVALLCGIYEKEGATQSARKISEALLDYFPDSGMVRELVLRYNAEAGVAPGDEEEKAEVLFMLTPDMMLDDEIVEEEPAPDTSIFINKLKKVAKLETMLFRIDRIKKSPIETV